MILDSLLQDCPGDGVCGDLKEVELQAGDVLNLSVQNETTTAVYTVPRPGPAGCEVSEGAQVDPSNSEPGIISLYDKDLTEGINLLISK